MRCLSSVLFDLGIAGVAGQFGTANAQDRVGHTLFVEGIGNGIGFTANYERSVPVEGVTWRFRAGIGTIPWDLEYSDEEAAEYAIPLTVAFSRWGVEVGFGVTLTTLDKNGFIPAGVIAYRYEFASHLVLRASVAPVHWQGSFNTESCGYRDSCPRQEFFPFPGLSVGYKL
jgi:hypothetical protein